MERIRFETTLCEIEDIWVSELVNFIELKPMVDRITSCIDTFSGFVKTLLTFNMPTAIFFLFSKF